MEVVFIALALVATVSLLGRRTIGRQIDGAIETDNVALHGCWVGVAGLFTAAVIIAVVVITIKASYIAGAN